MKIKLKNFKTVSWKSVPLNSCQYIFAYERSEKNLERCYLFVYFWSIPHTSTQISSFSLTCRVLHKMVHMLVFSVDFLIKQWICYATSTRQWKHQIIPSPVVNILSSVIHRNVILQTHFHILFLVCQDFYLFGNTKNHLFKWVQSDL